MNLLNRKRAVIFISNNVVRGVKINLRNLSITGDSYESVCNENDFSGCITEVISRLKTKEIDLLLDDQLCYILSFSLEKIHDKRYERADVFKQVQKHIPEVLNDYDWDYRIVGEVENKTSILVFAPIKTKFQKIANAILTSKCTVRAVEPVSLAKTRNEDPFLGISLKTDIKGIDSQILNITLDQFIPKEEKELKLKMKNTIIIITVLSFTVLILGIIYFLSKSLFETRNSRINSDRAISENENLQIEKLENSEIIESTETTSSETSLPETSEIKIDRSYYSLQILNGTVRVGLAAKVSDLLKTNEFVKIDVGNADKNNYENTVIRILTDKNPEQLKTILTKIIGEYELSSNPLNSENNYDVIIILGNDLIIGE